MKRKKVTKTFVQKECRALAARLESHCDARLADEIEKLASILQGTLKDIESRLASIEAQLSRIESFGL
jgi:hypothetical protein